MNHAPNSLGGVTGKYWLAAMEADGGGNLLNPHRLTLDIKNFAD
jgi:hypothetical protein